jgi:hypothetical protein
MWELLEYSLYIFLVLMFTTVLFAVGVVLMLLQEGVCAARNAGRVILSRLADWFERSIPALRFRWLPIRSTR